MCRQLNNANRVTLVLIAGFIASCAGAEQPASPSCIPGKVEQCPCENGDTATQECSVDGTFLACDCPAPTKADDAGDGWESSGPDTWTRTDPDTSNLGSDADATPDAGATNEDSFGADTPPALSDAGPIVDTVAESDGEQVDGLEVVADADSTGNKETFDDAAIDSTPNGDGVADTGALDCSKNKSCSTDGKCGTAWNGTCIAQSDSDCVASLNCTAQAKCSAVGGACVVTDSAKCKQSTGCLEVGKCSKYCIPTTGECVCIPSSGAECVASQACKQSGKCVIWKPDKTSNAALECVDPCKPQGGCQVSGLCATVNGKCAAATKEDCAGSKDCTKKGACSVKKGACLALSDADCAQTQNCKEKGICMATASGSCQLSNDGCKKSLNCSKYGSCAANTKVGACKAVDDADCKLSGFCKIAGRCTLNVASSTCIAASDSDCGQSDDCAEFGYCGATAKGNCTPTKAEHCKQAQVCTTAGECSFVDGKCVLGNDEDCKKTDGCKKYGKCSFAAGKCVQ